MFEVAQSYLIQLYDLIPAILGLTLLFGFIGDLLFKK